MPIRRTKSPTLPLIIERVGLYPIYILNYIINLKYLLHQEHVHNGAYGNAKQ